MPTFNKYVEALRSAFMKGPILKNLHEADTSNFLLRAIQSCSLTILGGC